MGLWFQRHFVVAFGLAAIGLVAGSAGARAPSDEPTLTAHDTIAAITDKASLRAEVGTVGGAPLAGQTVVFTLGSVEIGRKASDANGHVIVPWLVPEGSHLGANALTVTVQGTPLRATANLAVVKTATKLYGVVDQSVTAKVGTVFVNAGVQRITDGAILSHKTIRFTLDGKAANGVTGDGGLDAQATYKLPPSTFGKSLQYSAAFDGDDNYLPAGFGPQTVMINQPPPTPPPSWNFAIYPKKGSGPVQLGQSVELTVFAAYYPSNAAVPNVKLEIQAWYTNNYGQTTRWLVGGGTTDSKGLLTFTYTHTTQVPKGSYTMDVFWVKGGQRFPAVDANDPNYTQAPLVVASTDVTLKVTTPAPVAAGATAHIVTQASRTSDGKPAVCYLRLYKTGFTPGAAIPAFFPGNTGIDSGGNGWFDLAITPDIQLGQHVYYLLCMADQAGPYNSSNVVPVAIDVKPAPVRSQGVH